MATSSERTPDLGALLRRVAAGDADAFASFYDATCARVFGLILRVLRDSGYSEEATQEVYAQVWRSADSFDPAEGSALAWVMTLAHRRAVDRVRAEVAHSRREWDYGTTHIELAADVVAEAAARGDDRRRVVGCLGTLSDSQRQAIELAYYDGLTYVQVSERLATSLGTVKSRMREGLRKPRDCLGTP
ncbi:ECF RNA polymerase sigma factor SigK [Mycolicibacterium sp. TY66]|uniref:ECF RNA polymerase sigma factor SigK n=1 Tax=unclassified Mycolicibacterium TaxID=2636767 RepID=UPI001BB3263F|nr:MULTISPECIES: ECF RNA polymerase sigma factor SigK [unclassified Mycolicibacterium]BCI79945.1 ECF RNA polymerase sigma factor SigK [Mycolicibacterium sp. TY66]BCJ82389.1 ECF RNA polymerase sigma factor SigK [Mycolicibacterium sp. TY81]